MKYYITIEGQFEYTDDFITSNAFKLFIHENTDKTVGDNVHITLFEQYQPVYYKQIEKALKTQPIHEFPITLNSLIEGEIVKGFAIQTHPLESINHKLQNVGVLIDS